MTNEKSNQERAKEYDQIIAMQKILLQSLFANGVSIGGKPVAVSVNESQRVSLNRVGVKVERQDQPPKFKIGDRVTMHSISDPVEGFWKVISVYQSGGKANYRLAAFDNPSNTFEWTSEKYLEPYVEPAPVPFLSDDRFKQGDVVEIAKPRDHSEATGKPWIVTGKFSNNTVTISRFGVEPWLPANDKTVPVEILAKFPEAKYSDGQKVVFLDSSDNSVDAVVKNGRLIDEGYYLYELAPLGNYNFCYTSVPESNITGPYNPPAAPRFKPGDLVTTPDGREWIIDKIEMTEPETRDFHYWLRQVADHEYRNTARDYELTASKQSTILGAFYDTEEPVLFDPELVMTRAQRDRLMEILYGDDSDPLDAEAHIEMIKELFPQPE